MINNQVHQHNTRNATQLHKSYKRTNYVKHILSNKVVIWNELQFIPNNLKNIKSCNIFKNMIKNNSYKSFKSHIINQLYNVIYCTVDSFVYCGLLNLASHITFPIIYIYIYIHIYIAYIS